MAKNSSKDTPKECQSALTELFPKGYYPPHTPEMKKSWMNCWSLNILLFEAGVLDGISVLQGQRIGTIAEKQG